MEEREKTEITEQKETKEKKAKLEEPKMEVIRFREGDIIAFYSLSEPDPLGPDWTGFEPGTNP